MPYNQTSHGAVLRPIFGPTAKAASPKAAATMTTPPNIEELIRRPPNGLKSITDFAIIEGDENQKIGTIGFTFKYGGLTYETRFMSSDGNHNIEEFNIKIPAESPFLRAADPIGRAEKIYMLSVIHHKADTTWLRAHLSRLEDACFDDKIIQPEILVPHPIHASTLTPIKLFAHIGLSFPTDENYKDQPDAALKAFEYWDTQRRYVMDVAHYPQIDFYVSEPKISMLKSTSMYRKMAEDMLREVRLVAQRETDIAIYIGTKNFAENVNFAIQRLPSIDKILGGRSPV